MKYYLSEDVISGFQFHVYGRKGDCVTLVSKMEDHLSVVIVEDQHCNKFPCSVKVLSEQKVNPNPVQSNPEPVKEKKGRKKVEHTKLF
jgi:hypothetical protein